MQFQGLLGSFVPSSGPRGQCATLAHWFWSPAHAFLHKSSRSHQFLTEMGGTPTLWLPIMPTSPLQRSILSWLPSAGRSGLLPPRSQEALRQRGPLPPHSLALFCPGRMLSCWVSCFSMSHPSVGAGVVGMGGGVLRKRRGQDSQEQDC